MHHRDSTSLLHWHDVNGQCTDKPFETIYRSTYRHSDNKTNHHKHACKDSGMHPSIICNEPVHSRKNPSLIRRILTEQPVSTKPTLPLLAWGLNPIDNHSMQNCKPCVGDSTKRHIHRVQHDPVTSSSFHHS